MKGRTAIHELMIMNDEIRMICKPGVKSEDIRVLARKNGMRTLMEDGFVKVTQGVTTYEEILAAAK